VIALGSCAQPATAPKPTPASVTLSSVSPAAHAVLSLSGSQIQLSVNRIQNASGQAVGIHVVVHVCPALGDAGFDLGLVTPYPIDRTGTFVLELPSEAATKLKSCGGAAAVDMTLVPVHETEALRDGTTIVATVRPG
jgi:hypothetical protein